jgi:hypothetical protein
MGTNSLYVGEFGEPLRRSASVREGDAKHSASSAYVDSMETDANFLKDTNKPQYGRALHSGRRRGRPRGHGSRGRGCRSSSQQILNRERELEQSFEVSTMQVCSLYIVC